MVDHVGDKLADVEREKGPHVMTTQESELTFRSSVVDLPHGRLFDEKPDLPEPLEIVPWRGLTYINVTEWNHRVETMFLAGEPSAAQVSKARKQLLLGSRFQRT